MRVLTKLVLSTAACFWVLTPIPAQADIPQSERDALLALYDATDGDNWNDNTGWGDAAGTECNWTGVSCDSGETTVQGLSLADNHLVGTLPSELGDLSNIQDLNLAGNVLTGEIPSSLNLSSLDSVDLRWNGLHTDDSTLETFLDQRHPDGDVSATQTLDATGLVTTDTGDTFADLSWNQVQYTAQDGGYRIYVSTQSDGPFGEQAEVTPKSTTSTTVSGLTECTTYYAQARSFTSPHNNNENEVESDGEVANVLNFETSGYNCGGSGGGGDDGGYGSGGCVLDPNARFDPVLPGLVFLAIGYLALRRRLKV